MKFCQARLSPPLIGQIAAEASLDAPEEYSRETYDEYVERRKCLIDGKPHPGVYSPIPMGGISIRWPSCRLMTPISFVLGVFLILSTKDKPYLWLRHRALHHAGFRI